jgi:hypothetical protein
MSGLSDRALGASFAVSPFSGLMKPNRFSSNAIGDDGARELARMLEANSVLETLK